MINVLSSVQQVVNTLDFIEIIKDKIEEFSNSISQKDLKLSEISLATYEWKFEQLLELTFTFNVLNYCFWADKGNEKWTITLDGKKLDGSRALFRALEEELLSDNSFSTGSILSELSESDLERILQGNKKIPLFEERLHALNESGEILKAKFDDSWINVYRESKDSAVKLTKLLIDNFPTFDDKAVYKGQEIPFYKRAQLNSKMISDILVSKGEESLEDLDKLTAFADYKVPQILRSHGILMYERTLSEKIDNFEIISKNTNEEIEIRIATVWSVELIRQSLSKKFKEVTSSHIDNLLWNRAALLDRDRTPYHRTFTTAY